MRHGGLARRKFPCRWAGKSPYGRGVRRPEPEAFEQAHPVEGGLLVHRPEKRARADLAVAQPAGQRKGGLLGGVPGDHAEDPVQVVREGGGGHGELEPVAVLEQFVVEMA